MKKLLALIFTALALTACSTAPRMSNADRLALYQSHAGEPVNSFRLDRNFTWTSLGDDALAVWTGSNRGHLLEFRSRCTGLAFATRINITNSVNQVTARFDSVQLRNAPGAPVQSCRIWTIRPLDVRALNDSKREIRNADAVERDPGVTAEQE